jgi:FtsZ-interacting cell division protein ZipA
MNTSNKVINTIFIIIGVLALIALIIWGSFRLLSSPDSRVNGDSSMEVEVDSNPLLNESQENTLEAIGVEPETLPTEITPAMQVCFVEKLGAERAQEIADGDSPTPGDYVRAKACLSL